MSANNKPLTCFDCRRVVTEFMGQHGTQAYCVRDDATVNITAAYYGRYMRKDCPKLKGGKGENNEA